MRCAARRSPRPDVMTRALRKRKCFAGLAAAADYLAWLGARTGSNGTRREQISGAYRAASAL